MYEVLEHGRGVDQTIGHHEIFKVTSRGHKRGLPFIPFSYSHQIVSAAEVQLRKDGSRAKLFEGRRNERKGIFELDCALVQGPIINTWPQPSILLGDEKEAGCCGRCRMYP